MRPRNDSARSRPGPAGRLALAAVLAVFATACGDADEVFEYQTHVVGRGDLRITIRQKGTIEARDPVKVISPLEGRATLLSIAPEGEIVKKGEFLFELDVADQRDQLLAQEINTSSAAQALETDKQELEIQRQQNESDVKKAELNVLFAELDIKQYLEGDLPRDHQAAEAEITLAREELERARETLSWSIKLEEKGFISNDKLESDRLAVKRREIDLDLANKKFSVLEQYTAKKRRSELESQLEEARRELERVKVRASAAIRQKRSDVEKRQAQWGLQKTKEARLRKMVEDNVALAPRTGLVIYEREGRGRDTKPLEPGSQVREGQAVVSIPDMDRVLVDVDVHESSVHLVQLGMNVVVTTDTGETLIGQVESVATIADSQSWYRNPDLKVYSTKVTIDNRDQKLKPGMNCYAEIIVDELKDVLSVPVQAVYSNGDKSFCYVKEDGEPKLREVTVGLHNHERVHVESGLEDGDEVYLAVPPDAPAVPLAETKVVELPVAAATRTPPQRDARGEGADGGPRRGGREGRRPRLTPEQREKLKNMSPEERRKLWEQFGGRRGGGRRKGQEDQ